MDVGLEVTSGEDTADRSRVISDVPIAIEVRLNLGRQSLGTALVTVRKGDA